MHLLHSHVQGTRWISNKAIKADGLVKPMQTRNKHHPMNELRKNKSKVESVNPLSYYSTKQCKSSECCHSLPWPHCNCLLLLAYVSLSVVQFHMMTLCFLWKGSIWCDNCHYVCVRETESKQGGSWLGTRHFRFCFCWGCSVDCVWCAINNS